MIVTVNNQQFEVIVEKGEDGFLIGHVPVIPGCLTQGKDLIELKEMICDAIELCLEVAEIDSDYREKIKQAQEKMQKTGFVGVTLQVA